jgi:bifunctional oligoribonuclease and PAP phosphatase NrnA
MMDASRITLLSHARPDGDAYGSSLGLGLVLKQLGKDVQIYNEDGLLEMYQFLPASELIQPTPAASPTGLIVSLDTSTQERLGKKFLSWKRSVDINLDHHGSNTLYAEENIILPELPATAAAVIQLIQANHWPLPAAAASNLFVGLSTDTGSFRYRGTTAETFRQAAYLVESGADSAELSKNCYQSMSPARFALLRLAFQSIETELEGKLSHYTLTPEMFQISGAKPEDTEGIVETSLNVSSTQIGALFEIKADQALKVSLRSKGSINVSTIAQKFGGGGHPGAAGINFPDKATQNKQAVLEQLRKALLA